MRTIVLAALLVSVASFAETSVDFAKVYLGADGARLEVLMLKPAKDKKCVLRLTGTATDFDGRALPCDLDDSNRTRYRITANGGPWEVASSSRAGSGSLTLYLPGNKELAVSYDEAASQKLKVDELMKAHQAQGKSGALAAFAQFDRAGEQARQQERWVALLADANKACGTALTGQVAWPSASDEVLRRLSVASYCGNALEAMRGLCKHKAARELFAAGLSTLSCAWGTEPKFELAGKHLNFVVSETMSHEAPATWFKQSFPPTAGAPPPLPAGAEEVPWHQGQTLGDKIVLEETRVCADAKGRTVVLSERGALYYGTDAKTLHRVPTNHFAGTGWFLEPRHFARGNNSDFRGLDLRIFSRLEVDAEKNTCAVFCGDRKAPLEMLAPDKAAALLLATALVPPVQTREPYVLLRDSKGTYFYVERGLKPGEEKNFKLFIGPKGAAKQQKMVNVVSDSMGEIFSTKAGDLRLVIDRQKPSWWAAGNKRTELREVPIHENMALIFNELGIYAGQRLGTPCDDL